MPSTAKLLIVERVVPRGNDPSPAKLLDIRMLVTNAGGRERTEHEWRKLVESAGLRIVSIVRTGGPWDVLEAVVPGGAHADHAACA